MLAEALAHGHPCIHADIRSIIETISAKYVDVHSFGAMAQAHCALSLLAPCWVRLTQVPSDVKIKVYVVLQDLTSTSDPDLSLWRQRE